MRAAQVPGWGELPQWVDVDPPVRAPGEVLVRVAVAALNRLDNTVADGVLGTDGPVPYIGGVEASGIVVEADELATGQLVVVRGDGVGVHRPGCWAELVSAPTEAVIPLPNWLAPELAATFFQPTCAAFIALHDIGAVQSGESVVVIGAAGAVGSQAVQQALAAGASVIGAVGHADQLDRVHPGARAVLLTDADVLDRLAADRSADLLIDTVGGPGLGQRISWVRPRGRAVVVGYLAGMQATIDIPVWLMYDVALLPLNMLSRGKRAGEIAGELAERVRRGELTIDLEHYRPAEIGAALTRLRAGQVRGRAVMAL